VLVPLLILVAFVSIWGALTVPGEARFPIRFGGLGFQTSLGKWPALILWPLLAAAVAAGAATANDREPMLEWIGALALVILLIGQIAGILRAQRS
jgi:hypothetical protein